MLFEQNVQIKVQIERELYSKNCLETLSPLQPKNSELDSFLTESTAVWPF